MTQPHVTYRAFASCPDIEVTINGRSTGIASPHAVIALAALREEERIFLRSFPR